MFQQRKFNGLFDWLVKIVEKHEPKGNQIFHVYNKSGFTTVQEKTTKIAFLKVKWQVGTKISNERDVL